MIQLKGVSKRFGQRWAVRDLELNVRKGEIFGLLGHNGAGKSTAIGMMLGQVWPTSGEITICGHDIIGQRNRALGRVGAIFESPVFYDYLSGYRNLEILCHYTGPTDRKRINEVIDWVGLTGREGGKVRTYSHGMRTRLALAQALLPDPELLILDEPSDGLDPEGIHEMRRTIQRLRDELGLTILLSSHLLTEVQQLCTEIAVIREGKKVFEGKVAEIGKTKNWVRLRVNEFEKAAALLRENGLISEAADGCRVALVEGKGTNQIVKELVSADLEVFEITPEEQDLEKFYLGLMDQHRWGEAKGQSGFGPEP